MVVITTPTNNYLFTATAPLAAGMGAEAPISYTPPPAIAGPSGPSMLDSLNAQLALAGLSVNSPPSAFQGTTLQQISTAYNTPPPPYIPPPPPPAPPVILPPPPVPTPPPPPPPTPVIAPTSNVLDSTFTGFTFGSAVGYGDVGDVLIDQVGDRVNSAMWDNNDGTLGTGEFFTSSAQSASSGEYFYDVYRRDPNTYPTDLPQFSIGYGHWAGSGSSNLEGQSEGITPTKAIYKQYVNLLESKTDSDDRFMFSQSSDDAQALFIINIARGQLKERIDLGNWELHISGGWEGVYNNGEQTGIESNGPSSGVAPENTILKLVDEYASAASASSDDLGDRVGGYRIMSGTIDEGVADGGGDDYGRVYPNEGIILLNAVAISESCGGITVHGAASGALGTDSNWCYDCTAGTTKTDKANPTLENFFESIKSGSHFSSRNVENVHSRVYFCRIKNYQYNFSTNASFQATGSNGLPNGQFKHSSMFGDPKVYITTVGLYNAASELLAVAKLSKPLLKSFNREALIRVRLEF